MANNKRIQIQHWYTTGSTAPSGTGLTNMLLGEFAIATQTGKEAIFIKNNDGSAVTFMTSAQTDSLITEKLSNAGIAGDDVISTLSQNLTDHISTAAGNKNDLTPKAGHVLLVSGDLNVNTNSGNGLAAAANHTHGQYLTGVTAGSGLAIAGIIENGDVKLQLDSETDNKINSGVSGYTRIENHEPKSGTTEEIGHVKLVGGDLSGKTGNVTTGEAAASHHIHSQYIAKDEISNGLKIEGTGLNKKLSVKAKTDGGITVDASGVSINTNLKEKWNTAADRINTFLDVETGATEALDSLHEIQEYLTGDGNSVKTLLESLNNLTDAVSENTDDISDLTTSASTITSEINDLKSQQSNYVTSVIGSGNINAKPTDGVGRQFIVTHITAGTQTSEIKATNTTTGLSFGSEFNIVDNIGYDANGHVVSGSTKTLKLPFLPTGTTTNHGVVKLSNTTYENETAALAGGWSTLVGAAASIIHTHSQYAKSSDLGMTIDNGITIISCGTY